MPRQRREKKELEQEKADIETRIGFKEEEARRQLEILEKSKEENAKSIQAYKDIVDVIEKEITAVTNPIVTGKPFYIFKLIPAFVRDYLYKSVSKSRYKIFGRNDSCLIPKKNVKKNALNN